VKSDARRRLGSFLVIWAGQLVSLSGSGLTGFALGVWVYLETGSATQFALISLFTALPGIVLSPIAGVLVDRMNRRSAMILSDLGAGLCTAGIVILFATGNLAIWHIYLLVGLSSTFSSIQWPAYSAATALLVPKEHFGRASGMIQLAQAVAQVVSPVVAGVLMGFLRLEIIFLIDFATFLVALVTLVVVRIPDARETEYGAEARGSFWSEVAYGWKYIVARRGLLSLLLVFAAANFTVGIVEVLFTPLILSFASEAVLGGILSAAGIGFVAGSLVMSAWGGPRIKVGAILVFLGLEAAALLLAAFPPHALILGAAAFLFFVAEPFVGGCSQAIWLAKTPPDVQGRVFATRRMIAWSTLPLAYLVAGPLADRVFEPLMADGGGLSGSIGRIIGTGEGRGIALLYVLLAFALAAITLAGALYPRLRNLERELPDVVQG
jgi:MFS family permease